MSGSTSNSFVRILKVAVLMPFLCVSGEVTAQPNRPDLVVRIQSFPGVQRIVVLTADGKPVASDVDLWVVLQSSDYRTSLKSVSRQLTIAGGTNSGVTELPFYMRSNQWYRINLHVETDGNEVFNSDDIMQTQLSRSNNWSLIDYQLFVSSNISSIPDQSWVCTLRQQTNFAGSALGVVDPSRLPAFKELLPLYEAQGEITQGSVRSNISFLQNANKRLSSINPTDFFDYWASLASFRVVYISFEDLLSLEKESTKIDALKKWLITGGQLVVFNCGDDFARRHQVRAIATGQTSAVDQTQWQRPGAEIKNLGKFVSEQRWYGNSSNSSVVISASELNSNLVVFEDTEDFSSAKNKFLRTNCMRGRLIAVADDMTGWSTENWQVLHNAIHLSRSSVTSTIGNWSLSGTYHQGFRIPGIGDPPVLAFQVLIGLFVLVIGPGFYFLFNSTGRMHLLLVTTPLFSFAAVLVLFGYGILSDGFAIRGRVQSFTEIDHRTNSAYTHSRHVFYSGVGPRPCRYSELTLVADSRSRYSPSSKYRYRKKDLWISGGQIKARSPFQLAALNCFETDRRITLSSPEPDVERATITNNFADPVVLVAAKTKQGWYLGEDIDADISQPARQISFNELKSVIRKFVGPPARDNPGRQRRPFRNQIAFWNSPDGQGSKWGRSDDLIEDLKSGDFDEKLLETNSYIAFLRSNELVDDPQPSAIYEESQLHVIVGKW